MDAPGSYEALERVAATEGSRASIRVNAWRHGYAARPETPRTFAAPQNLHEPRAQ